MSARMLISRMWHWLRDEHNRGALQIIGAFLAAIVTAGWAVYLHYSDSDQAEDKKISTERVILEKESTASGTMKSQHGDKSKTSTPTELLPDTNEDMISSDANDNYKISLHNLTITDLNLTVEYSKNFNTCAHLLHSSRRSAHKKNWFCRYGEHIVVSVPLTSFINVVHGTHLRLCHGNNYSICSAEVAVSLGRS